MVYNETIPDYDVIGARLAETPGVRDADLSALPEAISLTLEPRGQLELVRRGVLSLLSDVGEFEAIPSVEIRATAPLLPRKMRRSRFEALTMAYPGRDRVAARVTLEWEDEILEGWAEAELNAVNEMKVAAGATLRAVERVVRNRASFNVMGIKEFTVFDHNLVIVLVHSPQVEDRLIGMVVVDGDRRRAAALAALTATNRIMGRFVEE